jgi:hypothetical protein
MIRDQVNNDENFYYYDGAIVNEDVYDSDVIETKISDIQKIKK